MSLMTNDVDHLVLCVLATYMSSLETCLLNSFALFTIGLFVFLLLSCKILYVNLVKVPYQMLVYDLQVFSLILWVDFDKVVYLFWIHFWNVFFFKSSPEEICLLIFFRVRGKEGDGGRERKKKRERDINMREKHRSVASHTPPTRDQTHSVLWPGIEPTIFCCRGRCSNQPGLKFLLYQIRDGRSLPCCPKSWQGLIPHERHSTTLELWIGPFLTFCAMACAISLFGIPTLPHPLYLTTSLYCPSKLSSDILSSSWGGGP